MRCTVLIRAQCTWSKQSAEKFLTKGLANPVLFESTPPAYNNYRRSLIYPDQIPVSYIVDKVEQMSFKHKLLHHSYGIDRLIPPDQREQYWGTISAAAKHEKYTSLQAEIAIQQLLDKKNFEKIEMLLNRLRETETMTKFRLDR